MMGEYLLYIDNLLIDGIYDDRLLIKKTSSLDVNKKFQNEGLHSDADYYGVLFLCVIPNQLYFKFIKKEDIPFASLHDRRSAGTGSGYKWDHKLTDVYPIDTIDEFREKFESTFSEVFR